MYKDVVKLDLVSLQSFPYPIEGKSINIIARVADKHRQIGTLLLRDGEGTKVGNIRATARDNPEVTMYEIFCKWLKEDAECSWESLLFCLRKCELHNLANSIEDALKHHMPPVLGTLHS